MSRRWLVPSIALFVAIIFGGIYLRPSDAPAPDRNETPTRTIVGAVGDVTGRPIAGARVWIDGRGDGYETRTDSHGRFRIDDATVGVHVVRADAASYAPAQQTVELTEADAQSEVEFRLSLDAP